MNRVTLLLLPLALVALPVVAGTSVPAEATSPAQEAASVQMPNFVPDVPTQFGKLARRGNGLAFHLSTTPEPTRCKHVQGVARYQAADDTPYLFVTRSGISPTGCFGSDGPGTLMVVRMDSRDKTGERMRSNRLDGAYGEAPFRDTVVETIVFDGHFGGNVQWPRSMHPGGMQLVGNVLAVALEAPFGGEPIESQILFIDVSDPESPRPISSVGIARAESNDEYSAGMVAITPIRTAAGCCRYLMAVAGHANNVLHFYRSSESALGLMNPGLTWEEAGTFWEDAIQECGAGWETGFNADQGLNFVREGNIDGRLFLLGARNTNPLVDGGEDWLDLWEVHFDGFDVRAHCPLTEVGRRHVTSAPIILEGDSANFAAGSGAYVSPSGELLVYATEFEEKISDVVRFVEYRNINEVRDDSPLYRPTVSAPASITVDEGAAVGLDAAAAPAVVRPWITLYEDDNAGEEVDFSNGATWVDLDYADRERPYVADLDHSFGFAEAAGSWRWFAPQGCSILVHDYPGWAPNFPGPHSVLIRGRGFVEKDTDLDSVAVYRPAGATTWVHPVPDGITPSSLNYNDDVGGVTFGADCDRYYTTPIDAKWDLDGDSTYETTQPASYDAASLDGPSTRVVSVRAEHLTDTTELGVSDAAPVTVEVRNVAPSMGGVSVRDVFDESASCLSGLGVTLDTTFVDPGRDDTQTATVEWGDGTSDTTFDQFADARGGAIGRLSDSHVYPADGIYTARVTVTDDDGGSVATTHDVCVARVGTTLTAEPAIARIRGLQVNLFTLEARLTRVDTGAGIGGQVVEMTVPRSGGGTPLTVCTATTGTDGWGTCNGRAALLAITLSGGYDVRYATNPTYTGAMARGPLILVL